jgi:hypothetical protein
VNTDKVNESGLTPKVINGAVTYEEATFTFVCRKICQLPIKKEDIAQDIRDYYAANPQGYPVDENGDLSSSLDIHGRNYRHRRQALIKFGPVSTEDSSKTSAVLFFCLQAGSVLLSPT